MNKYKSIYVEDIVNLEMEAIKEIIKSDAPVENKVSEIAAIMGFVEKLTEEEEQG